MTTGSIRGWYALESHPRCERESLVYRSLASTDNSHRLAKDSQPGTSLERIKNRRLDKCLERQDNLK